MDDGKYSDDLIAPQGLKGKYSIPVRTVPTVLTRDTVNVPADIMVTTEMIDNNVVVGDDPAIMNEFLEVNEEELQNNNESIFPEGIDVDDDNEFVAM